MNKIIYNSIIAKGLLYFSPCDLIMLFGMVFSKAKKEDVPQGVINHENVHIRQWNEMTMLSGIIILALVLIFGISAWWMLLSGVTYYVWYAIEFMCKSVYYSIMNDNWDCPSKRLNPYKELSFEREARLADKDDNYLANSKYFAWLWMIQESHDV